jgi:O-antigen ligase
MLLLILIFSILFTGLTWYRPVLALQLTLFALPAYLIRFKIGIPLTLLELMILINFGIWLIRNFAQVSQGLKSRLTTKGQVINYPFAVEMILVVLVGLFGAGVAHFSSGAMGVWKAYFFEPVLLLLVTYNIIGRLEIDLSEKYKKLITPLIWSALVVSLVAIYQNITGNLIDNTLWQASATRRVVSVFGYPNAVGLYLETIIIYCVGLMVLIFNNQFSIFSKFSIRQLPRKSFENFKIGNSLKIENWNLIIYIIAFVLALLSILFAKSNGAALGLIAGFAVFGLLYSKRSRLIFCSLALLFFFLVLSINTTRTKALEYLTLRDFSGQVRLIGWSESWSMLKDGRLLTGAGLDNFQTVVASYHVPGFYYNINHDPDFHRKLVIFEQKYRDKFWQPLEIYKYPHNIILNFWSELGLLGLLTFIWLVGRFYYLGFRYLKQESQESRVKSQESTRIILITSLTAMTTIIVHGLVDVPFFKNDLAIIFWLPIVIVGLHQLEQKSRDLKVLKK